MVIGTMPPMDFPRITIILLCVVSVVLPMLGLFRLFAGVKDDVKKLSEGASDPDDPMTWQIGPSIAVVMNASKRRPLEVKQDIWIIGVGLIAGGVANVWSLFV